MYSVANGLELEIKCCDDKGIITAEYHIFLSDCLFRPTR